MSGRATLRVTPLDPPFPLNKYLFTDILPVRIHYIVVMIQWTGLAPWGFELPFPQIDLISELGPFPT